MGRSFEDGVQVPQASFDKKITAKMASKPTVKNMAELTYSNPVVFFDIAIGGVPQGRMKFELYADRVPKYPFPPLFPSH